MKINKDTFNIHWGKFQAILFLALCLIIPGYSYLLSIGQGDVSNTVELTLLFVNSIIYSFPVLMLGMIFFSYWWGNMRILWKSGNDEKSNYTMFGLAALSGIIIFYISHVVNWLVSFKVSFNFSIVYFYILLILTTTIMLFLLFIWRIVRRRNSFGGIK